MGMTRSESGKLGWIKSQQVRQENLKKIRDTYYSNPKKCRNCDSVILFENRDNNFCGHRCAAITNNGGHGIKIKRICLYCKTELKHGKLYCSFICQHKFHRQQKIAAGKSLYRIGMRLYLSETRGYKCEICKNDVWQDKSIPLEIDHINGDSTNNNLDNVRLICPNCHAQTPTYKSKNRGKGRQSRRQRYHDGKSY